MGNKMNLLTALLDSGNGSLVDTIAGALNLSQDDTRKAITTVAPAFSHAVKRNTASQDGLSGLLKALSSGNHGRYVDHPETLSRSETIADGNAILGHLFGSKEVSRNVAGHASQETGVDYGKLKKMLPMVAAAVMGAMNKKSSSSGPLGQLIGGGSGGGFLESFLDTDNDGSVVDDILSLAKKAF